MNHCGGGRLGRIGQIVSRFGWGLLGEGCSSEGYRESENEKGAYGFHDLYEGK
jgi:hypothetical protein